MAKSIEEHAYIALEEHLEGDKSRKRAIEEAKKIIREGRLLCLSEMSYQVEGSPHGREKKREVYTVTRGVGAGVKSCSCRAREFGREACKHWLAVTGYTIGMRRRKEELEAEHAELVRRANVLLEEASELSLM